MDGIRLEQQHGKSKVRVGRVWKQANGVHHFVEWNVSISLLSDCIAAYTRGDNSDIVATDTMKNTVYVKAKECIQQLSVEDFAILLGRHFTSFYKQVTVAIIKIVEKPWERIHTNSQPHEHGFKLGSERHTTEVTTKKTGEVQVISGIEGLSLLKTTQSGFEGFIRDKYTILLETRERMLATEITATWRYAFETQASIPVTKCYFTERYMNVKQTLIATFFGPPEGVYSSSVQSTLYHMAKAVLLGYPDVSSVQLKMPNIHFLPVNLSNKYTPAMVKFEDDVFLPTDEPHGSIEANLSRISSKM